MTTIECQNAFVSIQCCALCGGQNKCNYKLWYKDQMHMLKVCSVHSIHSLWKSKQNNGWHTCNTYVITTWRLELQAPLVARDYPLYKIQTCQYNILANSFWVTLIKHEIFVLLWQEFLKTSQLLPHISNKFIFRGLPNFSKKCVNPCKNL